ncbi:hypothetical protein RDV84_12975 [Lysobacter yananisis]|uniref:XRE family transcriptional regulator n=1 Tax=Lysobacter yananisis TaxID=1003114 RepID=A0ABY9PIS6_9GAMM|nr:hypothetical protein [Lysobacter yananisis]WMT05712.1 hypothetical protein RDV84_12975 [Lysobacter yananisis]
MNRERAMEFLHKAMELPGINRSSIGKVLQIDASQVSRIAAGRFTKLDGHALRVCKYAQSLVEGAHTHADGSFSELERKLARLSSVNPDVARAVSDLIDALAKD